MKLPRRQFLHLAASVAALPAVSRVAWAQAYPSRPVRLIAPFAPGGAADILVRLIGQWMSKRLGQPFVTENRPGGGGNIGTEAAVKTAIRCSKFLRLTRSTQRSTTTLDWHESDVSVRLCRLSVEDRTTYAQCEFFAF
jgi:tripartite-type tricarboxylate transporter receptor subunit TctC